MKPAGIRLIFCPRRVGASLADLFIFIMRFYLKAPLLTLLPDPRHDRTRGIVNEHLPRVIISRPFDCHVAALFQAAALLGHPPLQTPVQFRMRRKADSYFPSVSRRAGSGEIAQSSQVSRALRKCDRQCSQVYPIKNGIGVCYRGMEVCRRA